MKSTNLYSWLATTRGCGISTRRLEISSNVGNWNAGVFESRAALAWLLLLPLLHGACVDAKCAPGDGIDSRCRVLSFEDRDATVSREDASQADAGQVPDDDAGTPGDGQDGRPFSADAGAPGHECAPGLVANEQACQDRDECAEAGQECAPGTCASHAGTYTCTCPDGYAGSGTQACADIDECEDNNGGCGLAACSNTTGSFACGACPEEFTGSDGACLWNDPSLSGLSIEGARLSPALAGAVNDYVVEAGPGVPAVTFVPSLPAQGVGRATIQLDGVTLDHGVASQAFPLALGDRPAELRVVAESGTARTYNLLLRRGWSFDSYFKASNTGTGDRFASSLAISADGSTLAVGAAEEDSAGTGVGADQLDDSASGAGAVYVFRRWPGGWVQEAYLKASNAEQADVFGRSVSLSADGSTLVVGAPGEDGGGTGVNPDLQADDSVVDAGAAYVFERTRSGWAQTAYLKASNPAFNNAPFWTMTHKFGAAVSLSGDGSILAVGAPGEASRATGVNGNQAQDFVNYTSAGAVYMFHRVDGSWVFVGYLKSTQTQSGAAFGDALALNADGSLLAVGEASANVDTGAVYTYTRRDMTWSAQSRIIARFAGDQDSFGQSLSMSADGNTLLVGAPGEDSAVTGVGGGLEREADNTADRAGAAYVFVRRNQSWEQDAYLKPSNTAPRMDFGSRVALSADGRTAAVSMHFDTSTAVLGGAQSGSETRNVGSVFLFQVRDERWTQLAYIKSPTPKASQYFGYRLSLDASGKSLVVGTEFESNGATGVNGTFGGPAMGSSGAVFLYE